MFVFYCCYGVIIIESANLNKSLCDCIHRITSTDSSQCLEYLKCVDPSVNLCLQLIMPRCACASEVYGSVFVFVLLQLLNDK